MVPRRCISARPSPLAKDGNWIQTASGKGINVMLRLYSPLEPFLTKQWRPSEVELVK
jgi:hypothetical protein